MNLEIQTIYRHKTGPFMVSYLRDGVYGMKAVTIECMLGFGMWTKHNFKEIEGKTPHEWVMRDGKITDINLLIKYLGHLIKKPLRQTTELRQLTDLSKLINN